MSRTSTSTHTSHESVLKLLERHANVVFGLLICILSIILLTLVPHYFPNLTEICIAIGTSLLSSLIFAVIYSGISERYHMMVIRNELAHCVREEMKEVMHAYRILLPDDEFPSPNGPTARFHRVLTDSLKKSRSYAFKGVTGRHIPGRLREVKARNLRCDILLVDPRKEELLRLYIRDRFGAWNSQQELLARMEEVKREIYMALVGLFDQARQLGIEIGVGVSTSPIFYRTELLDDLALISYFTEKTATDYPTTYLYRKDSFFYDTIYTDIRQTRGLASASMQFDIGKTEAELQQFLTELGCDGKQVTLSELRQSAETFDAQFRKALKAVSDHAHETTS